MKSGGITRRPEFNRTVFAHIDGLREESTGASPSERDMNVLQDWLAWQASKNSRQPKFSFLFFDAPHGYDFPKEFQSKYLPQVDEIDYLNLNNGTNPEPIFNRYKNSVLFTDQLIGQVVETLEASGEFENTLLIITGDHGQEMNDTKQNYWGHNSNFTRYQVQVPLVLSGASVEKLSPNSVMTSHVDIAPTLLKEYLGVTNPIEDYSTGYNLFELPEVRPWVLASSYNDFAVISENRIFEVDNSGLYRWLDAENKPVDNEENAAYYRAL